MQHEYESTTTAGCEEMGALRISILPCGERAICPFCKKEYAVPPSVHSIATHGVWAHIRTKHKGQTRGGMHEAFVSEVGRAANLRRKKQKEREAAEKTRLAAERKEAREAPKRKHLVTGGFLMDVCEQLSSALDMMEPYYSQCDADAEGRKMVARIEGMISKAQVKS